MPKEPVVWVIIPTFNRQKLLNICINDLLLQTYSSLKIVVVDDGTDNAYQSIHKDFPSIITLKTAGNKWWTGSINVGLSYIVPIAKQGDFVLTFNDDVRVNSEFIQNIISDSITVGGGALIGALAVDIKNQEKIVFSGTKIDWKSGKWGAEKKTSLYKHKELILTDSLPGRGCLIPIKAFNDIGYYDEKNFPQYLGDEDYVITAKENGYSLYVSTQAIVKSHVEETGIGRYNQTLRQFIRSLFSIRSPNQLTRRKKFIYKHAPKKYRLSFWLIDSVKVITSFFRHKEMRK